MESKQTRKILKSPVAKRRSRLIPKDQKVTLERVLGLTTTSNATFACDPNTGLIAYPAGCVVVIYNPKKNKQGHIFNVSKKTLTSLAFSGDGKHLITGESGYQPAVRVWDVVEKTQVAEFHGHKFGINCVAFSPNLKYIVSVGTQHDKQVNVWNWRTGSKVASNKVSIKVTSVSFSSDGSYFVTAGMRHVKFWYLENSKSKINETVPLNGRNGILGDHKNNFFCDVVTGTGPEGKQTFCITQSGFLCQFNETRQMDKWVELRTTSANSISVAGKYIFVGCAKGIVRVFDSSSLHYVTTLPRPHHLGVDIAEAVNPSQLNSAKDGDLKYPDTLCVRYDEEHSKCTCIYNDHSMYIWDVHDLKKIGKAWSFLYHSSCVYGIEVYPTLENGSQPILPPHSFFTCSSDDTIRVWNLDPHMAETSNYKSNIYSHDLLKIMYMDPSLTSLCDIDYNPSGATDKTDTNYDDKNGIRSIRVSPDGQHLASGDRQGNVRIHELDKLIEIKQIEAHESEVLSLEYSHWKNGPKLLASSSRDRLIHVFDVEQQYGLLQTLSDHSSSISAVKFVNTDDELKMISCGADKSIMFRNLKQDPEFHFSMATQKVEKMTLYDMDVEPMQKFTAIACQDRNVRIYNVRTGKKKKEYKGSLSDDGILLKMKLDPSGSYAATSCSDKNMCIIDFYTGELQATMFGHSEIATDVRFMNDLRHVISSSGDGCIFVWRLPQSMTSQMQSRLKDIGHISPQLVNGGIKPTETLESVNQDVVDAVIEDREFLSPERILKEIYPTYYSNKDTPSPKDDKDFRFSISQIPGWAQKPFDGDGAENKSSTEESGPGPAPRRRWAQRADGQGPTIKTQDGKSVELDGDRRRFSYQADAANSQSADPRRETMVLNRPEVAPTNMPVIFDEGNDDDDDDFLPVSSKTFVKQDTQDKSDVTWDDLYNFDADEGDQGDNTEIIYYPPSESDGSDTLASSYQVFDAGLSSERRRSQFKHSISINSNADGDSETTDPVSLDDIDDDDDSNNSVPTTPMDEPPKSQNREKFLKDTFENLSFTPSETDKFVKGLETLEEEMDSAPAGLITSRQSLSARFLSKSQAVRGVGPCSNLQRQDNWYDSVQRGKDNMARNLDESRKMLMAMGWKQDSPETEGEEPFVDSHKSPTSPKHVTPKQNQDKSSSKSSTPSDDGLINSAINIRDHQPTPPTSSAGVTSRSSDQHHTPTSSRRSLSSSSRPRTLPLDRSGGRGTPTDKSTNKMTVKSGSNSRKDTPTGSQHSTRLSEYKKNTRLSTPNLGKVQMVTPEPRRSSSGSNLAKSRSNSMHNLTFEDDEQELTPRGTNRKSRSKWSTRMSSFASVPNLLNPDDDGKLTVVSFDENKQDINDNVLKEKKSGKPTMKKSPQVGSRGDSDVRLTRRAASTSRLQSEEKKSLNRKVGVSATNLRSLDRSKDRDLMPPPAFTSVAKKQETRFMKRAQQPRRKTTGASELTFEEAKNILKGNSGVLNGKEKRSSSISPTRNSSRGVKGIDNEDMVSKSDLSNNVTDSEMSSVESRKSSSSSILSLGNKVDQFEALDGDTSSECDTHKNRGRPSKSPTRVSVKPILAKDLNNDSINNDYKDSLRDSGVSTQDEEDCPSPSVKERIARLNKHTGSTEKLHPHSLLRDQNRAESPEPNSSRQTSTVQISLNTSSVSTSSSASVAMATSNDSMTTVGSSVSPLRGTDSFQSSVQTLSDNSYTLHQNTSTSPSSLSNPNLSPPSGMGTSLDSEGLSHHLSPGNQSNGSPRSVADTGLGSDTDLELSQTFRRGQFSGPGDSHSMVEKLDQMLVLMNQISVQHKQMQDSPENGYAEVMTQCDQRFKSLCTSYCETFGKSLNSVTGKDEIIQEALNELQRNVQKFKDLVDS